MEAEAEDEVAADQPEDEEDGGSLAQSVAGEPPGEGGLHASSCAALAEKLMLRLPWVARCPKGPGCTVFPVRRVGGSGKRLLRLSLDFTSMLGVGRL